MTREDRVKKRRLELEAEAKVLRGRGDLMRLPGVMRKIEECDKELREIHRYRSQRLSEVIGHDEMIRDDIYRKLLKCSLAADYLNNCSAEVRSALRKYGINDYSFRSDVDELCRMSQRLASLVIIPNQESLTDMIVDDDEFIDTCDRACEEHLKNKLGI